MTASDPVGVSIFEPAPHSAVVPGIRLAVSEGIWIRVQWPARVLCSSQNVPDPCAET
jgi:hypothetical protein